MTYTLKASGLTQMLSVCIQFFTHNGRYVCQNLAFLLGYWNVCKKKQFSSICVSMECGTNHDSWMLLVAPYTQCNARNTQTIRLF